MFSPTKAIAAGALVFAIGGALFMAQPLDQHTASFPGAAAVPAAPVEFNGMWGHGPELVPSEAETVNGDIVETGAVFQPTVIAMSDPRLKGDVTVTPNSIAYGGEDGPVLWHKAFRIENADGAWQELPSYTMFMPDGSSWDWTSVFVGEGKYKGLLAIANVDYSSTAGTWGLHGYIVEGEAPVAPELPPTD